MAATRAGQNPDSSNPPGVTLKLGNNPQPPRRREAILLSNEMVAPSIHVLTFGLRSEDPMEFAPGQAVTFYLQREGRTVTRSYSIYSSTDWHDRFSLLIKRVPQGFGSNYLCDMVPSPSAKARILAPLGKFVLHPPENRTVVMVATGVGIAPFAPMLELLHRTCPSNPVWLFWGSRFVEEMVNRDRLEGLERTWPNFHFVPVISRPPSDGTWRGVVGHVQAPVQASFPDLSREDVYLCGASRMISEMQDLAIVHHCPKERVFVDRWGEHGD